MHDVSQLRADSRVIAELHRSTAVDTATLQRSRDALAAADDAAPLAVFAADTAVIDALEDAVKRRSFRIDRMEDVERVAPDVAEPWRAVIETLGSLAELLQERSGTVADAATLVDEANSGLAAVDLALVARQQAIAGLLR